MVLYTVTMGDDEFDPWCGIPTTYIHKTIRGAWEELGKQLDELLFKRYKRDISKIFDIDIDVKNNRLTATYELYGFPYIRKVLTLQIQCQVVVE